MSEHHLIIHRAANEIGGNCIEITSGKTRVLFDFGLPLYSIGENEPARKYRLKISGVYKDDIPRVKAVFITHAHPDHCGLLAELNSKIPVYAAPSAILLLKNIAPLFGNNFGHLHFIPLNPNETVSFDELKIKSIPLDHSIPQSYAYQIETGGKKILYTGDFRSHGKCSYLTKNLTLCKKPDYLILEGTTLNRPPQIALSEKSLQSKTEELLRRNKLAIIYFSAQNLDRFISVYNAARTLHKTIVIDPYTCFVLEQFSQLGKNIPQWYWPNIRVYFANNTITKKLKEIKYRYKTKKISLKEILSEPSKYVIKDNSNIRLKLLRLTKEVSLIHSAWPGYLEKDCLFKENSEIFKLPIDILHTSGHADFDTLSHLIREVSPRFLIPIHTCRAQEYQSLFKVPALPLKNGEILDI